jgi:hypothetical protein
MKHSNLMKRVSFTATVPLTVVVAAWAAGAFDVTASICNGSTTPCNGSTSTTPYTLQSDGSTSATYAGDFTPSTHVVPDYYQLDLSLDRSRSVLLTLNPLPDNPAGPFTGPLALPGAILYSRCFTPSGGYQDWTQIQPATPDFNCSMRVNFTYNGVNYILVMSPEYRGTGTATVTCTNWSTSANSCIAWTDVPNSGAANPNVALLLNKSNGESPIGYYSLTFNVTLTHP